MTEFSVSKADGPNLIEIVSDVRIRSEGDRPIRKNGFHRALKRGEIWALMDQGMRNIMNKTFADMFREQIFEPSPFLGLLNELK